jgi:hypothetical protein
MAGLAGQGVAIAIFFLIYKKVAEKMPHLS